MKTKHIHLCNVLEVGVEHRQIWQFVFENGQARLNAEKVAAVTESLPARWAAKDWRCLWQRKLNLAWLPADQMFLRVVQLPASEPAELQSMIELQLEKLSPLPVAQVVWGMEIVPASPTVDRLLNPTLDANRSPSPTDAALEKESEPSPQPESETEVVAAAPLQTVVVLIAARNVVQDFLGSLEGLGYLADRLELPLLRQLLSSRTGSDGLWLAPDCGPGQNLCLVGWWNQGTLQNLNLLRISTGENWASILTEQLTQITWAGEMEGWMTGVPHCHLIADAKTAAAWEPVLRQWVEESINVVPPLDPPALAALNAQKLAGGEATANLLPSEYSTRYQQQFVDRLWMRGLLAVGAIYVLFVLVYFAGVQVVRFMQHRVEKQIAGITSTYTNALQLKARVQVMQEQVNLRYAALECWKAASLLLPQDLTLSALNLQYGRNLVIHGTAPADQVSQIIEYNKAMSQYRVGGTNGPLLFSKVNSYNSTTRPGPGGTTLVNWDFACELQRSDIE